MRIGIARYCIVAVLHQKPEAKNYAANVLSRSKHRVAIVQNSRKICYFAKIHTKEFWKILS